MNSHSFRGLQPQSFSLHRFFARQWAKMGQKAPPCVEGFPFTMRQRMVGHVCDPAIHIVDHVRVIDRRARLPFWANHNWRENIGTSFHQTVQQSNAPVYCSPVLEERRRGHTKGATDAMR